MNFFRAGCAGPGRLAGPDAAPPPRCGWPRPMKLVPPAGFQAAAMAAHLAGVQAVVLQADIELLAAEQLQARCHAAEGAAGIEGGLGGPAARGRGVQPGMAIPMVGAAEAQADIEIRPQHVALVQVDTTADFNA